MARRFRVVIADDEPLARARVESLLRSQSDCEVVARCESGAETVTTVRRVRPDILFLDVQMPGGDGFTVLEKLDTDIPPVVIFVTAFDQHALRAFEVHALDYLLKPFDADRFARAVDRARAQLTRGSAASRALRHSHDVGQDHFPTRVGSRLGRGGRQLRAIALRQGSALAART